MKIPDDPMVLDGQITHIGYRLQASGFRIHLEDEKRPSL
jgi:hypothetical protein